MDLTTREMSSFLMFRTINPVGKNTIADYFPNRVPVHTSEELQNHLELRVKKYVRGGVYSSCLKRRD